MIRIVNATDGSLPRKPCKTCKNRFHAACLYKVRPNPVLLIISGTPRLTWDAVVQHEPFIKLPAVPFRDHDWEVALAAKSN